MTTKDDQEQLNEPDLKSKTAKGLFWGGISNFTLIVLGTFFGLFMTRILSPDDWGLIAMLAIFTEIALLIQRSGFSTILINRPFCHKDYNAVFWFSLVVGTLSYIILFLCSPLIARFFNYPELTNLARVQFLGILLGGMMTAHLAVLVKKFMVKERAITNITSITISGLVGLFLAFKGFAYWAIVIQTVLNNFIILVFYWAYSPWRPTFSFTFEPLKEMLPFSIKILLSGIVEKINSNIFSVLLGKFYTKTITGYYYQGDKWARMANTIIINMMNEVSQPALVEAGAEAETERQRNVFRKLLRFISFISFPIMLGLALVSNEFIVIAVTEKWLPCVPILQILCIWGAFSPLAGLYYQLVISKNRSDLYMWNAIGLGVIQTAAIFSTMSFGVHYMVLVYTIVNIFWLLVWHFSACKLINLRLWHVLKDILPFLLVAIASLGTAWLITKEIDNIYIRFISKIFISVVLYIGIMWGSGSVIIRECFNFILRKNVQI